MGANQSVYMANSASKDIYVMVSLNPDWAIVDFITDVALLFVAVGEIKQIATAAELPATLSTIVDLFNFLKISVQLSMATAGAATRPAEAALALINAFKKNSIRIPAGEYKDISDRNVLEIYLSASGIAGLVGASAVSVMVMSDDGKQLAMFNTNADYSWIATNEQKLVRSKYGSIWQQDPGAGTVDWVVPTN